MPATPALWVDVGGVRLAPVVISGSPPIKMDEKLAIFDVCNGSHGNETGIESVLGLKFHVGFETIQIDGWSWFRVGLYLR